MKVYCLSGHPNQPCLVVKFKSTTIMLDCALGLTSALSFLPLPLVHSARLANLPMWKPKDSSLSVDVKTACQDLKECAGEPFIDAMPEFAVPETELLNLEEVDCILISNYRYMLALPFITEYSGFKGIVYATEPSLQTGRQFMEELVHYLERRPKERLSNKWKSSDLLRYVPQHFREAIKQSTSWRHCYSRQDIRSSLARVQMVNFGEKLSLFGCVNLAPVSSGYCIGSCNWVIQSAHEKIVYLSSSSTLTTHPKPMEQAPLRDSDVIILTGLTQTPTTNPDSMIGEFCVSAAVTLQNGGNVLVPCNSSGVVYDLFECLSAHLDNSGLGQIPFYFISPVADSSLAYSNIFSEWLSHSKQSKVYLPEEPFPHALLEKKGRLKRYANVHDIAHSDFRMPCVVFAGHPSLRFGDAVHFVELWGKSGGNTIIFTEPDYLHLEALAPYQPLAMKAAYCPIDTSLSYGQANKLIAELKPRHLLLADAYTHPVARRNDLLIEAEASTITYTKGQVVKTPLRREFEYMEIDTELASKLEPVEIRPGVAIATLTGNMSIKDNKIILKPLSADPPQTKKRPLQTKPSKYLWGAVDVPQFVQALVRQGIADVKVTDSGDGHIVHLPNEDTLIQVEQNSTHIFCGGDEEFRRKLKDALLRCLSKF